MSHLIVLVAMMFVALLIGTAQAEYTPAERYARALERRNSGNSYYGTTNNRCEAGVTDELVLASLESELQGGSSITTVQLLATWLTQLFDPYDKFGWRKLCWNSLCDERSEYTVEYYQAVYEPGQSLVTEQGIYTTGNFVRWEVVTRTECEHNFIVRCMSHPISQPFEQYCSDPVFCINPIQQ